MFNRLFRLIITPYHPLRRLAGGLVVGAIVGAALGLALDANLFSSVRTRLQDALYRPRPTRDIVALVAADDASLDAYGRTTAEWDRRVYIDLVAQLEAAGARVIAFDILFANPTEADDELAEALRTAREVIQPVAGVGDPLPPGEGALFTFSQYIRPVPVLAETAMGLGHVNHVPDRDGFMRRTPLLVRQGEERLPALGLAAYLEYLRMVPQMVQIDGEMLQFAGREIPVDEHAQMLVYFFGEPSHPGDPASTFPTYSLVDVVEGRFPAGAFEDRIVLIGVLDATALPDRFPVPGIAPGHRMYGVEIHAHIIETLHQSLPSFQGRVDWRMDLGLFELPIYEGTTDFPLREQPVGEQLLTLWVVALAAGAILPFFRWYVGLVLVGIGYAAYFFWASVMFTVNSTVVEIMYPGWALGLCYVGTLIVVYVFEQRRRGQIHDLFSRYVSPEIAQRVVEEHDRGRLKLGGEERVLTVLFADVRGFTPLVERTPPVEVVAVLNAFLEEMSAIVMRYGGAINKFIGDNLMAFWNAPYPQGDHAWLAVQAGLEMLAAIERLNASGRFREPVQFGIGIATGPVVIGNIGSRQRLEYTPIGDAVNVAARLSGLAPGGVCYIGPETRAHVGSRIVPVATHHLLLKGKRAEIAVYELRPSQPPQVAPDQ